MRPWLRGHRAVGRTPQQHAQIVHARAQAKARQQAAQLKAPAPPAPARLPQPPAQRRLLQPREPVTHMDKARRFATMERDLERAGANPDLIQQTLARHGLLPLGGGRFGSEQQLGFASTHGPGYLLAKTLGQLSEAAVSSPAGIYHVGKDVGLDYADLYRHPGQSPFRRTRGDAAQMAKQTYQDLRHPLDRPGYALLDAGAAVSAGAGTFARFGAAGRALADEGSAASRVGAALTRPGHKGGSLLRRPEPGTMKLSLGKVTVERPLSRNAAARVVQRVRNKGLQRTLDRGSKEPLLPGTRRYEQYRSAHSTFGRELRATRRIEADLARAPLLELERAIRRHGRGLNPAEHTAMNVAAIEGAGAFANPAEAVARHAAMHHTWANEDEHAAAAVSDRAAQLEHQAQHAPEDEANSLLKRANELHQEAAGMMQSATDNRTYARMVGRSQKVLEHPSDKFKNAVRKTKMVSDLTTHELVARGLLHPDAAAGRRANIANLYRGVERLPGEPKYLADARRDVARLQRRFDRATGRREPTIQREIVKQGKRAADLVERGRQPHALETAQARLSFLERQHNRLVAKALERKRSNRVGPEQAQARLAEHDLKIHAAELKLAAAKKALEENPPTQRHFAFSEGKQIGKATKEELGVHRARKELAALQRDRRRYVDATKNGGYLRIPIDRGDIARKNRFSPGLAKHEAEQERLAVEAELKQAAEKNASHPSAQAHLDALAEMDRLRGGLSHLQDKYLFAPGRPARAEALQHLGPNPATRAEVGQVHRVGNTVVGPLGEVLQPHEAHVGKVGGALSIAKDKLAAAEKRAKSELGHVPEHGFRGGFPPSEPPPGSFYFPLTKRYTDLSVTGPGGFSGVRRAGGAGINEPAASSYVAGIGKQFTGESVKAGKTTRAQPAIADRYARVMKLASVHDFYDTLWNASHETKLSKWDVPIGSTDAVKGELRKLLSDLADQVHSHPDEVATVDREALTRFEALLQQPSHAHLPVGAKAEGVRWVDGRLIQDLGEKSLRGPLERLGDAFNNPFRVAALYVRPAYALNALGNAGMAAVTQGILAPKVTMWALRSRRIVGDSDTAKIDAGMGMSRSRAYSVGTGPLGHASDKLGQIWNDLTDLWFRRSSFYHEALKAGFGPDRVPELLNDPAHKAKLTEVFRRSRKNAVDFNSMTPLERNTLRHIVYFYPWISRGSIWALRSAVEHPAKTWTLAQLAQIGERDQHKAFGKLPAWARSIGLIPIGAAHKGIIDTVNPSSVWTPTTLAQAGQTAVDTAKGIIGLKSGGLSQAATPIASVFANLIAPDTTSGAYGGLIGQIEQSPIPQALRRAGVFGSPAKTYPDIGVGSAVGPFTGGGLVPRATSLPALHKQAAKELPKDERAYQRVYQQRTQLAADAVHYGLLKKGQRFPAPIRNAFNLKAERAKALSGLKHADPQYQHKAFDVELRLLARHKIITPAQARQASKAWAPYGEVSIKTVRSKVWRQYGGGVYISSATSAVNRKKREASVAQATHPRP